MKASYKILSIATSILFIYLFFLLFFNSESFLQDLGLEPSLAGIVLARRAAMFMLGIAILSFVSRNLASSKARQFICLSIAVSMFGLSCMGAYEYQQGNINSSIMLAITIETILWISYGLIAFGDRKAEAKQLSIN